MKKTYLALRQLISPFIQYGATITAHLFKHPRYLTAFPRLFFHFQQCKKLRQNELHEGVIVPLFLILSLTKRCNLKCALLRPSSRNVFSINSFIVENNTRSERLRDFRICFSRRRTFPFPQFIEFTTF